jgi:hypothetical protein
MWGRSCDAVVGLNPGRPIAVKSWAPSRFSDLARRIAASGRRVLVMWGPGEEETARAIVRDAGSAAVLAPATALADLPGLLVACAALVTIDSGLKHLAVCVRVPTVTLFGATDPREWHMGGDADAFLWRGLSCSPCRRRRVPFGARVHGRAGRSGLERDARVLEHGREGDGVNLDHISVVVTAFNEGANARCLIARVVSGADRRRFVQQRTTRWPSRASGPRSCIGGRTRRRRPEELGRARAQNDWVLVLDADEALDDATRAEIAALDAGEHAGFWIRRRSDYLGRTIRGCGWQRDKVLRLYDRRRGRYPDAWVHEEVVLDGAAGRLSGRLRHTPYRDVEHHLAKIDAYTTRGARQYVERGGRMALVNMLVHPPFRFLRMYVLQAGVRDGYAGLVLCLLSSYSVMLKYAKAWGGARRVNGVCLFGATTRVTAQRGDTFRAGASPVCPS